MARRIELKIIPAENKEGTPFKYSTIITNLLNTESRGMSIDRVRTRMDIIKKIEQIGDSPNAALTLEETEWKELLEKIKQPNLWSAVSQEIIEFCDEIENAEKVKL